MSKKANLNPIVNSTNSTAAINAELEKVNEQFDNTLSLDGSTPNSMNADLDLDSNDILNVGTLNADEIIINGSSVTESVQTSQEAAEAAATAAGNSRDQAASIASSISPDFPSILIMSNYDSAADGQLVTVTDSVNGAQEPFVYVAGNSLVPDGVLVVDAVGMGVGRFISKRRFTSSLAELASFTSDNVDVGDVVESLSSNSKYRRAEDSSTDADLDYLSDGGLKWYILVGTSVTNKGMYKWKVATTLPRSPSDALAFSSTMGGSTAYPQALGASEDGNTLFLARAAAGGTITSSDYVVTAYDITNMSAPSRISTFRIQTGASREYLIYIEKDGSKFLYAGTNNNPARFDITTMPIDGSTVAPETTFTGVRNYNHVAFDGDKFWVPTGLTDNTSGDRTRADVVVWDADLSTRLGSTLVPRQLSSAFTQPLLDGMLKTQGVAFHDGKLIYGLGGLYTLPTMNDRDSNMQGVAIYDPLTRDLQTFVVPAITAHSAFAELFGQTVAETDVVENEGIVVIKGKVYLLMVSSGDAAFCLTGGLHLVEISSDDPDAVDFSPYARLPKTAGFDPETATYYGWAADQDGEIKHPVTGTVLSTVQDLADAMMDSHMSSVRVYTTGLTVPLLDPNGVNVSSGTFVNLYHIRGFGCNVELVSNQSWKRWWYSGGTFSEDKVERDGDGTFKIGDFGERSNNPALGNTLGVSVRPFGQMQASAGAIAQYLNTQRSGGIQAFYLNGSWSGSIVAESGRVTLRSASGGRLGPCSGNPEGSIAEPTGTWLFSTDGNIYFKNTGTGNTGWVVK